MAEAPRPRPVEVYNPRPLILGICFFWGIAMGFCLFYFAPPKQMGGQGDDGKENVLVPTPTSDLETRRRENTPDIAPVLATPETLQQANRLKIETMEMDPPAPILTTEGGLTGRTAHILRQRVRDTSRPATQPLRPGTRPSTPIPPPIPELMP